MRPQREDHQKVNEPVSLNELVWIPGSGMDSIRVDDWPPTFGKPREPLGEAWFLGETRYLDDDINRYGFEGISESRASACLDEATSGMCSFGSTASFPDWFGYLASRVLRSKSMMNEGEFETICLGVVLMSNSAPEASVTKHEKAFAAALAVWIMDDQFWKNGQYLPLRNEKIWTDSWGVYGFDPGLATSLLIAWRYVHPKGQRTWLRSVLAIEDPLWRAQFTLWLVKVAPIFERGLADRDALKQIGIGEMWGESYRLMIHLKYVGNDEIWSLIPPENISALHAAVREEFSEKRLFEWIDQFSAIPNLWTLMEVLLDQLQANFS